MDGEICQQKACGNDDHTDQTIHLMISIGPTSYPRIFLSSSCVFNGNAVKSIQVHILWYKHTHIYIYIYVVIPCIYNIYI